MLLLPGEASRYSCSRAGGKAGSRSSRLTDCGMIIRVQVENLPPRPPFKNCLCSPDFHIPCAASAYVRDPHPFIKAVLSCSHQPPDTTLLSLYRVYEQVNVQNTYTEKYMHTATSACSSKLPALVLYPLPLFACVCFGLQISATTSC